MIRERLQTRWGAHLRDDGSAIFHLWAPAVEHLRLRLGGDERAMQPRGDGWFELEADDIRAGAAYQFVLPDGMAVPDPASRAQASDVHGPSLLTASDFDWKVKDWMGRPWEEAVIYELHPGTFSRDGGFDGIRRKLDHLADLGFTAIELMPVAQFSGKRGWGYDGVLPYCPHSAYGGVTGLKRLVDAAHERGLMMMLDVVYNHFGPDGNYLHAYAPDFFDSGRQTPWGPAIRFEEPAVRAFFLDNPLYWLEEFRFDGLRFDAIDQIRDESETPVLEEMAREIRERFADRHIHLTTEDERNIVALHPRDGENRPILFTAEWNDDFHHAAHCIATGEDEGYYAGFADHPAGHLARALAEGFCYQGEPYAPRDGEPRGVPSTGQPPTAFVNFLQNHDQIGNRAFGERLTELAEPETVELLTAVLLLNPQVPLVFMGEEYGETNPFLFFTDFHGDLAKAVREGRRREFADFGHSSGNEAERIPDPNALSTFQASMLDWDRMEAGPGRRRLDLYRRLLELRRTHLVPHVRAMQSMQGRAEHLGEKAFCVRWPMAGRALRMVANFGTTDVSLAKDLAGFDVIYESRGDMLAALQQGRLPAKSVTVLLAEAVE
ncbi:malto-oligosyltrehalose trehalohydrolase [Phyllobacterium salinisoli]|uniref:Malto-oligosyltrehalose trehalohydrolase n=1 Tax=Phyllobacterium salinisoli TaxID=1899321 RepID=A0A368K7J3_9HYPH|nr:malto-oligosyltrehalose trehalohydrolase [Phyllobacterium salinisoli]RCS25326.1 malto-oligosyltrehalose trehalohydrolase [Phyllobacterium salinisoli]